MSVLIANALVLGEQGFAPGAVLVEGDRIAAIGEAAQLRHRAREVVDAAGCWLIPGLIDAHAHGYSSLLRGTENALPLELWALYTVLYGRAFDAEAIRAAILLGAAERIRAGITGVVDHTPYVGLWREAIAAHEQSGLRVGYAAFLHDISDYDLLKLDLPPEVAAMAGALPRLDARAYAARFAEAHGAASAGSGRVQVQLGPNAPQRCTPEAWALWRRLQERHDVRVHLHLMETRAQAMIGARDWEGGLVAEMARQDLLRPGLAAAHGVWLTEAERGRLAEAGAVVVHNPASNLMLGSGVMDLLAHRRLGLATALGSDSANTGGRADMFEIMRLAMMLPRVATQDHTAWPTPREVLTMASETGAAVLGLGGQAGRIAPGMLADLALVRHDGAAALALDPSVAALVQHASPDAVESVMVGGTWLMRDKRILAFDEAAARAAASDAMAAIRDRVAPGRRVLDAALPGIAARLKALMAG